MCSSKSSQSEGFVLHLLMTSHGTFMTIRMLNPMKISFFYLVLSKTTKLASLLSIAPATATVVHQ